MKTITVRDLQKKVRECVNAAQTDRVVITRQQDRRRLTMVGVEGTDWETVVLEANARFWRLIESRRKQSTITMADMRRRVGTGRAQGSKHR